ncbi:MAG: hypothetical protein GF418_16550, partial [Chitinivibrionales bacterium]|nr:hypothetical protein [Chitinivibrionales bacterium]
MMHRHRYTVLIACVCIGALGMPRPLGGAPRKHKEDMWRSSQGLVSRLGAEWYKIGVLRRELASMNDVLADLRNIELFPEPLTGLSEKGLVSFDKRVETIEKRLKRISGRVDDFKTPLSDAMAILREMVVDQPVKDMVEILEEGDLERIERMLALKHEIDDL